MQFMNAIQKVTSFQHLRARKGVDTAHLTSETLQFIDSVMENIKVKQRALQALLASTAFPEVKERAAATAVEGNNVCSQVDQIGLFKIGLSYYTEIDTPLPSPLCSEVF
jgi:hypothetical protein